MIQLFPKLSTIGIKITICRSKNFSPDQYYIFFIFHFLILILLNSKDENSHCFEFFYFCTYNARMMLGEQIAH